MNIAQFRLDFPEFTDTARYPTTQIMFWSNVGDQLLNECVWGDLKPFALELYTAHQITLAAQNELTATNGGFPGQSGGIANNKTVGSVSVGYDSNVTSYANAGWWNLTNYGKQLYNLIRLFGAGCIQL